MAFKILWFSVGLDNSLSKLLKFIVFQFFVPGADHYLVITREI